MLRNICSSWCAKQSLDSYLPFKETEAVDDNTASLSLPLLRSDWVRIQTQIQDSFLHAMLPNNVRLRLGEVFMKKIKNKDTWEKDDIGKKREKEAYVFTLNNCMKKAATNW